MDNYLKKKKMKAKSQSDHSFLHRSKLLKQNNNNNNDNEKNNLKENKSLIQWGIEPAILS